jgi:SIR2-like domain
MISVFLGAGFSAVAGVPLASHLFDSRPQVDAITRQRLVERVLFGWNRWRALNPKMPQEYLADLQINGGKAWLDAQWYVALTIALTMGRVERVGTKLRITRHNVDRTTGIATHETFWTMLFRHTTAIGVVTTNYDILAERGIRHRERPRVPRPGFHYGDGPERLRGGGYPSYAHIQMVTASGSVPLFKLHGSVSWGVQKRRLVHYHDCRPAIRGDAAILAPVTAKALPAYLKPIWNKARALLTSSRTWIVVGYSLPEYDKMVRELLSETAHPDLSVHVFDPNSSASRRFRMLLPDCRVIAHHGLPEGLPDIERIIMDLTPADRVG